MARSFIPDSAEKWDAWGFMKKAGNTKEVFESIRVAGKGVMDQPLRAWHGPEVDAFYNFLGE
jgi:hypothetical protein